METYDLTDDEDLLLSDADQHTTAQTVQPDTDQHMTEHTIYDTLKIDLALPPLDTANTTNSTTTTYTSTHSISSIPINPPQSNPGPSTMHDNTSSNPIPSTSQTNSHIYINPKVKTKPSIHSKAGQNQINSLTHSYHSLFYHEKQCSLLKTAYDNQHPPAYIHSNLNIHIYDNIHKDDKQQWDKLIHDTQMGITNLLIRHHERAILQVQTVITITENFIRQVYGDNHFLHEIIQTARERALYELTRERRRRRDDTELTIQETTTEKRNDKGEMTETYNYNGTSNIHRSSVQSTFHQHKHKK